jgi:hypothetical protein
MHEVAEATCEAASRALAKVGCATRQVLALTRELMYRTGCQWTRWYHAPLAIDSQFEMEGRPTLTMCGQMILYRHVLV